MMLESTWTEVLNFFDEGTKWKGSKSSMNSFLKVHRNLPPALAIKMELNLTKTTSRTKETVFFQCSCKFQKTTTVPKTKITPFMRQTRRVTNERKLWDVPTSAKGQSGEQKFLPSWGKDRGSVSRVCSGVQNQPQQKKENLSKPKPNQTS